jgi:cytochrome c peroxidase
MRRSLRGLAGAAALGLAACGGGGGGSGDDPVVVDPEVYVFDLPAGFPQPRIDADDPMSDAKVALGRQLFYDPRMAFDGEGSCVSCNEQRLAFTDGRETSIGPGGDVHPRNAMSLTNAVYNARQNWANPNIRNLREQALFTATLISGDSAYDRRQMTESARRGEALFFSERLECNHCHAGFNLANSVVHAGTTIDNIEYRNNALYNIARRATGYPLERGKNFICDPRFADPFGHVPMHEHCAPP